MALLIDLTSTSRRLGGEDLRTWAQEHTAFISSEMGQLRPEREALAHALRQQGMNVVMFEDMGGRDEDAKRAYLEGVARSDIYIGFVGDRYGQMQASGRSPTHEEYLRARQLGKRISFWVAQDDSSRQGNARDFVQEVQTFHTTGRFSNSEDLARRVVERISEMAADDEAPWVKVGDAVLRVMVFRDFGDSFEIEAEIRDTAVAHFLEGLRPNRWGQSSQTPLSTSQRSGSATIEQVTSESQSASKWKIKLSGQVDWGDERADVMAAGTGGYSPEDLIEIGLRAGLLGEEPPDSLGMMEFMVNTSDPLAELRPVPLPESSAQPVARLLLTEQLIGGGRIARIEQFALGPEIQGERQLSLSYLERRRYSNVEPARRTIEGAWRSRLAPRA